MPRVSRPSTQTQPGRGTLSGGMTDRAVRRRAERGQAAVIFALCLMALLAMLALAVDVGIVYLGQRRFDQNGADAAALAVGTLLARNVSVDPTDPALRTIFYVTEDAAYATARKYAGLDPDDPTDYRSTGVNQNGALADRVGLALSLEYWGTDEWGADWCFTTVAQEPERRPGQNVCAPFTPDTGSPTPVRFVPPPDPAIPFKVRVTVSSTTRGFFSEVVGLGDARPTAPQRRADGAAACVRPKVNVAGAWQDPVPAARGVTTCAQAVVSIAGRSDATDDPSIPILPFATCPLAQLAGHALLTVWSGGLNGLPCLGGHGWPGVVDLSASPAWCDAPGGVTSPTNKDYVFRTLLPPGAYANPACIQEPTGDTWNRAGRYAPEPGYPGSVDLANDLAHWTVRGFGGTLQAGARVPTYIGTDPDSTAQLEGSVGNWIAQALYCISGAGCDASAAFFARPAGAPPEDPRDPSAALFRSVCPDPFGDLRMGCRDARIIVWDPTSGERADETGAAWIPAGSDPPQRVRVQQIVRIRLYCVHRIVTDPSTPCNVLPPPSLVGLVLGAPEGTPFVAGRLVPALEPLSQALPCPTCTVGPSLNGVRVALES